MQNNQMKNEHYFNVILTFDFSVCFCPTCLTLGAFVLDVRFGFDPVVGFWVLGFARDTAVVLVG